MIDRTLVFNNYIGASFPNFSGKNASGAAAVDGTEWLAEYIDNWGWGWEQALLSHEGITPNGVTEAAGASQILDAIQNILPPGSIIEWNLNTDPATYGARFLPLNGQGILRANYPELDSNVYVGDGNNATVAAAGAPFYRADDAAGVTPNIVGIYLILPESRGYTTRGLDLAASIDPLGASRYLGDNQDDAMQRITGSILDITGGVNRPIRNLGNTSGVFSPGASTGDPRPSGASFDSADGAHLNFDNNDSTSPNSAKTDDNETRMINRSTQFVIRY